MLMIWYISREPRLNVHIMHWCSIQLISASTLLKDPQTFQQLPADASLEIGEIYISLETKDKFRIFSILQSFDRISSVKTNWSDFLGWYQNPYNQNPYNHNPYCVGILIGSVGILIGFVGILIGLVGILIGSAGLTLSCRDYDWCNLGWKISVGISISRRDFDRS